MDGLACHVTSVSVFLCEDQWCAFYAFGTEQAGPGFLVDNVDHNPVVAIGHLSFTIILRENCHQGKEGIAVDEKDGKYLSLALTEQRQGTVGILPPDLRKQQESVEPQPDCRGDRRSVHWQKTELRTSW